MKIVTDEDTVIHTPTLLEALGLRITSLPRTFSDFTMILVAHYSPSFLSNPVHNLSKALLNSLNSTHKPHEQFMPSRDDYLTSLPEEAANTELGTRNNAACLRQCSDRGVSNHLLL